MWLPWRSCRHYLSAVTLSSIFSRIVSCAIHTLSTSALPTSLLQVLKSARSSWMMMMTMTALWTLVINQGLNLMRLSLHHSHQSVRRGLGVYAVIPSNLLWILSTTFVHRIPESKNLLGLSSTVPRMIPSYVMLHHYSLCSNVSVFFKRWDLMFLELPALILDNK